MIHSILSIYGDQPRIAIAMLLMEVVLITAALIFHEVAHGYIAYKCGDTTARDQGRLSLNPLNHLDPIGFLMLLLIGFGYARPVPVNMRRLRKPRRDMALVALAGPVSNLLLALLSAIIGGLLAALFPQASFLSIPGVARIALELFMQLNIGLALFNLIPLPPLDGSNILLFFLSQSATVKYLQVRHYTTYIFGGIILLSWLSDYSTICSMINGIIWLPFTLLRGLIGGAFETLGYLLFSWI